jgi:hypothetical protein
MLPPGSQFHGYNCGNYAIMAMKYLFSPLLMFIWPTDGAEQARAGTHAGALPATVDLMSHHNSTGSGSWVNG